ncbi:MAG TPA: cytochrome b/b6 domain-containing protein [Burkholderiales bacterium]|jgi:cytochrome b|nr:cytochrome b/b6 domain-containing protein [Burkholderiales bacterium]
MSPDVYDAPTRLIHLLLALLGVAALVSGQFADDYRRAAHPGFDVHSVIGLALAAALALRIAWGFFGPAAVRFAQWLPLTRPRLDACAQDLAGLARLRLPHRPGHQGLAGLVQAIGLCAFAWMAVSGMLLWFYLEPGARAVGWIRTVKELHEGGQAVAIAYVALHAGAVLIHSLAGDPVWRRMAPWRMH